MKSRFKKITIRIVFLFFVFLLLFYFTYQRNINRPLDVRGEKKIFVVPTGISVGQVGQKLFKEKLIRSDFFFQLYCRWSNNENKLQAGAYELSPSANIKEITAILAAGKTISKETVITFIEGWTSRDIAKKIEEAGFFSIKDFYALAGEPFTQCQKNSPLLKNYASQFDFLADKPNCQGLEGYLFPDTYRVYANASADDIILKMLANLDKKLTSEMRADIKKQNKTIYEIITMASVIEKEVAKEEDMKIVSGIFWNRLENSQPLESCATLAYILGVNKAIYTIEDTQTDSLYNTYRHQGLPPGPISNPGMAAISAAIYPTETSYFYFLSRSDNGETVFAKTYAEHLQNKEKYLK
ncbi:MAG: endolytic transglycosylase MltG [Patescibacteria group bacterium]|jgi:UPF0755 protein